MFETWSLQCLADYLGGRLKGDDIQIDRIETDSRKCAVGVLFVGLNGERFKGANFACNAVAAGASAVLIDTEIATLSAPQIIVDDTLLALGKLGALNRLNYKAPLIGVTGSAGKTTTRAMITTICQQAAQTHSTVGNFNNEIGVPLTLLNLTAVDQFSVVEMGAAKLQDIAYLTELVKPTVGLVVNVLPAHIEGFGSIEGVARTKSEMYLGLAAGGIAVIDADSPYIEQFEKDAGDAERIYFSTQANPKAQISAVDAVLTKDGFPQFKLVIDQQDYLVTLNILGMHNVFNAVAAAACANAAKVPTSEILKGLSVFKPEAGRMCPIVHPSNALLIDDTYNSNPAAVLAAAKLLASFSGRRILVLGHMAELGVESDRFHRELGEALNALQLDQLILVGQKAFTIGDNYQLDVQYCDTDVGAAAGVAEQLSSDVKVLFKGSRSANIERVIARLFEFNKD